MGDMKTPDFDDLLAAFDIPDIDAKEAIQSSPEEDRNEVGTNADERESGSPSCFPCPPASHSDPPVVSVIVKNIVRSESFEEEEKSVGDKTDNPSSSDLNSQVQVKVGNITSQLGLKIPADASVEPQVANGFEGSVPRDQGESSTEPWPPRSPLRSTLNANEGENDKGAEVGSLQHTTDVMNSLKPLLQLQSSTCAGPNSSTPLSLHSVSPHLSTYSPQKEERNTPSSSPLPQNGSIKAGFKHVMFSDEEDSEPDLGSPLVIQESPESVMSSPPKFKNRAKLRSELLRSSDTTSCLVSPPPRLPSLAPAKPKPQREEEGRRKTPRSPSKAPKLQSLPTLSMSSASVKEEKYPEHVIDERDSPESPPPSETGLVVAKKSRSPESAQTAANHKDFGHQEELMESEPREDDRPGDTEELSGKVARDNLNKESCGAGTGQPVSARAAQKVSSPLRPLKVKIKMPTGSITRTVTGVAPKRSGRATTKGVNSTKRSPERLNTRSKRESSQQPQLPAMAMLQDACTATLESARMVKDKTAADTKPKVSLTAVSITKSSALPTISVGTPRGSPGGINPRSLGPKTLSSGMTLPAPSPLLTPQSNSRPASIVNSTGAIISKTQTNLVEAFNKILNNKNLLPSYKPDLSSPLPAEWGLPLPAQGYRCLECGDAFALEQSLARHYDRRSLRIEVTCNHCAKRLAFYNKCSLLFHAREHKEKGLIMQCSHLVMKPVPVEQMIGQQEPSATGPLPSKGQAPPNPKSQPHQAVLKKKAEAVQYISNKCPECQVQFSSKEEVAEHFQEIKATQTSSCTECSPPMLLPNSCSAAAHQRIHQGCPAHVCPECGGTAKQPLFQTHLDETCLHFARRIGYRCSSCLVVFGGLNSVKAHIQQAHCDMFHKCPSCPMAFKSAPSTQNHISAQHPTLTEGQTMSIYKCVMCDTVFTNKSLLYIHFDTHLTNQKVHVFKCPECTKLFSQRKSLLDHFKSHKTLPLKQELPSPPAASSHPRPSVKLDSSDGEEWMDEEKEEKVKTEKMKTPTGWKCAPCHARYTDREDYITHMAVQHSKKLKKFPCNKCESSFTTTSSMRRHIRDKHKVMSRSFRCQFCSEGKKTFSSRAMLERHVQLRHGNDPEIQDALMGGRDEADSSSEQDGSPAPCRRQTGAAKMEQDEESTDGVSPVKKLRTSSSAPAPYSLPESGFRCAPCGFTTEDHASFLEHISKHRRGGAEGGGGGGQQCLQCGACFTSISSLSRHRFITHKVKDVSTDQQSLSVHPAPSPGNSRNHDDKSSLDGSAPASPSSQFSIALGKEDEGSLACRVCGKQFEKATDLTTHFRTHGMAFINARNSAKTP
ncbi:zinc finger protein 687a [Cottoperca gobio]|uniref:Zinc finger protein 687a-like n=1 Tax=Cottoperca gobio TaxID=56716 RepID=A0A6J2RCP5_COTGO|nr:zinc finger protein 687a-like [Cottoperca gobio]XP_029308015.1 zinc finger protein 687a-like [Cottoperca gobio]